MLLSIAVLFRTAKKFYTDVHQQMKGKTKCGVYIQWNISLKRKEILTHATAWLTFEDVTLTEISQSQKGKYYTIPLT